MQPVHETVGAVAGVRHARPLPRTSRPPVRVLAATVLAVALAGGLTSCASRTAAPPAPQPPGAGRPTRIVQPAPARPSTPRPDVTGATACTTGQLAASLAAGRTVGGYGYASIDLVDTGDTACTLTADVTVVPLTPTSARMAVPHGWANTAHVERVPLSAHGVPRYGTAVPEADSWAEIVIGGALTGPLAPAGTTCSDPSVTPAFWQVSVGTAQFVVANATQNGPLQACGPRWSDLDVYAQG